MFMLGGLFSTSGFEKSKCGDTERTVLWCVSSPPNAPIL